MRTDTKNDIRIKEFIVEDASQEVPYSTAVCPHCKQSNFTFRRLDGTWSGFMAVGDFICSHLEDIISVDKFRHTVTFVFTKQ